MDKSIQTSQSMKFKDYSPCDSTKLDFPKAHKYATPNNQLICSKIMASMKEKAQKQRENATHN